MHVVFQYWMSHSIWYSYVLGLGVKSVLKKLLKRNYGILVILGVQYIVVFQCGFVVLSRAVPPPSLMPPPVTICTSFQPDIMISLFVVFADRFLAFKTPLGPRYDDQIPEANRFQLPMLFAYLQSLRVRLHLFEMSNQSINPFDWSIESLWLKDWLIEWLTEWLNYWLIDLPDCCVTDWTGWLIDWNGNWWLTNWFDWLKDWLVDWLIDWFHWLIERLIS